MWYWECFEIFRKILRNLENFEMFKDIPCFHSFGLVLYIPCYISYTSLKSLKQQISKMADADNIEAPESSSSTLYCKNVLIIQFGQRVSDLENVLRISRKVIAFLYDFTRYLWKCLGYTLDHSTTFYWSSSSENVTI